MGSVKIVSASAGSGKTYNLAYEYVSNVIRNPELYRHILAVTFTNKATEEMKLRILSKINELSRGIEREFIKTLPGELKLSEKEIERRATVVRTNILHDYGRFAVLTIDKFFQRIIRSFIRELGIENDFTLELPVDNLLFRAADRVIDDISTDKELRDWIIAFVGERMEESKKWDIRGEVVKLGREVFTESYKKGLQSARTREELAKIVRAYTAEAETIRNGLTATAKEALDIIATNGLTISDFAYGGSGVMGYVAKIAAGRLEAPSKRAVAALHEGQWYTSKCPKETAARIDAIVPQLSEALRKISEACTSGIPRINSAGLLRENFRNFALLDDLQRRIADVAREENILHISEINFLLSKLISGNDAPFIFEKTGETFSHFMIDEFQDTSAMQWENFVPLLKNAVAQSPATPVMLVGDVKQSIYRWRGGDWTTLSEKAPAAFDETISFPLQDNYRSRRTIVELNNALTGLVTEIDNRKLNDMLAGALAKGYITQEFAGNMTDAAQTAYADYEQNPKPGSDGGYATIRFYDKGEGPPVIRMIEEAQERGFAPRDIAVLVRRKAEGRQIAAMMLEHKAANPGSPHSFDVITQDALVIGGAPVSNFIAACLRLSSNPDDGISRVAYNRYLGRPLTGELPIGERETLSQVRLKSLEESFETIVIKYRLNEKRSELAYLQAFHEQIISFSGSNIADIPLFVEWWDETGCNESVSMSSEVNAVTIDTVHRAKGLGYKVVIIPYANWSMVPMPGSVVWSDPEGTNTAEIGSYPVKFKKAMAESIFAEDYYRECVMSHIDNLNIFYVALTRAKEELHIMIPRTGGTDRINGLIEESITEEGVSASIGGMRGFKSGDGATISFGSPEKHERSGREESRTVAVAFESHEVEGRITISLKAQRYFDDGAQDVRLTPRGYGILMHRVFEQAEGIADIERNIAALRGENAISDGEADSLGKNIAEAFGNPLVGGWFEGPWDEVRNENSIITPGSDKYRPDRVMIRGKSAVVVDYKFGLVNDVRYPRQIAGYKSLLSRMGYTDVKGYIWYINSNTITEV